ncbi:DUF1566 domain-containing protein [Ectothiorhodospiraceae bacterium BW-2]|nr:DUF1566 domain-containing protein [Ectothiorhodospiraceae bacterium BW-2]
MPAVVLYLLLIPFTLHAEWFTQPLNDTGITWGGNYSSGNNATCIGETVTEQDCSHGRDADPATNDDSNGHAGFSFTKISATGEELSASATEWSCVKDNVTGLMWEVKTDDGGIHDKDNTYRWGGKTARLSDGSTFGPRYDDWDALVDGANNASFCGYSDWRVPSKEELRSIVNYGRVNPAIDSAYFPNAVGSAYWSSSPYANGSGYAWLLNFINGNDDNFNRNNSYRVRLVRAGQ